MLEMVESHGLNLHENIWCWVKSLIPCELMMSQVTKMSSWPKKHGRNVTASFIPGVITSMVVPPPFSITDLSLDSFSHMKVEKRDDGDAPNSSIWGSWDPLNSVKSYLKSFKLPPPSFFIFNPALLPQFHFSSSGSAAPIQYVKSKKNLYPHHGFS